MLRSFEEIKKAIDKDGDWGRDEEDAEEGRWSRGDHIQALKKFLSNLKFSTSFRCVKSMFYLYN